MSDVGERSNLMLAELVTQPLSTNRVEIIMFKLIDVSIKRYPCESKKSDIDFKCSTHTISLGNDIIHSQNVVIENQLRDLLRENDGALEVAYSTCISFE